MKFFEVKLNIYKRIRNLLESIKNMIIHNRKEVLIAICVIVIFVNPSIVNAYIGSSFTQVDPNSPNKQNSLAFWFIVITIEMILWGI